MSLSFVLEDTSSCHNPLPTQIERRTRSYLATYPQHLSVFFDRLKLCDLYIQARADDGEDVRALRDELTDIFVVRDLERLNVFIKNVAIIKP